MTNRGKGIDGPRRNRLIGILVALGLLVGGVVACQAIRAADPESQCRDAGDTWVEGYVATPYCEHLTPIKRTR